MVANRPGHLIGAIWQHRGTGRQEPPGGSDRECSRPCSGRAIGGQHRGGGAIGKQRIGHHPLGVPTQLLVQAAEFEGAEQHPGPGIGLPKGMGHPQAIEGPVTAHEAHLGAGHIRVHRQPLDQVQVESGGLKAGAAHRHQVGDRSRIDGGGGQGRAGGHQGQGTGLGSKAGHALAGGGIGTCVEGQAIVQGAVGIRQQHAVAEGDAGTALQTPQQGGLDVIGR